MKYSAFQVNHAVIVLIGEADSHKGSLTADNVLDNVKLGLTKLMESTKVASSKLAVNVIVLLLSNSISNCMPSAFLPSSQISKLVLRNAVRQRHKIDPTSASLVQQKKQG